MSDNRNFLIAIILSAIVLFGWTYVAETWFPTARDPSTEFVDGEQVALPQPEADPAADRPEAVRDRREVLAETPRIPIATPHLEGSLNLEGARIDDLVLTRYRQSLAEDSPPIRLLSPAGAPKAYFAGFGWTGEGLEVPGNDAVWRTEGDRLAPGDPVTLAWDNGAGQRFEIELAVDEHYMFTARQRVENRGDGPVAVRPYALVSRVGESPDPDSWTIHTGPIGVFDGTRETVDFDDLAEAGTERFTTRGGWLGFGDKYWLAAIAPDPGTEADAAFRRGAGDSYQADIAPDTVILAPGKAASYEARVFAGAKEVALLDDYEDELGIDQLDKAIDWGWFYWFEKPIFYLLWWLFQAIGNFGVAIICLTIIVRVLMFPIAQKQFASMAAMRAVQPKMKALQERHKDDKQRLQQEMMKLYRDEKVNPLAGCMPLILQIPIFYALYKVLLLAVEMRHEPFALWIKDLSAPDPLTPVNLFGYLDFTPPSFLAIGILPIILGISMYFQFKLQPMTDPIQRQVFGIMPWVFMFIMAPFAAGLQLYWAVSNLLTIAQQKWLYSKHPALKASLAAEAKEAEAKAAGKKAAEPEGKPARSK
ncbi:MAG: membrane protein insertase YidC [Sphingomonadaceae bacterium]